MMGRVVRWLTAATIVAGGGWAVWHGADMIRFQLSSPALAGGDAQPDALRTWRDKPWLGSLAIAQALRAPVEAGDLAQARARQRLLMDLLARRPAASETWIALAASRYGVGMPAASVAAAFKMSALTGPNEAAAMFQRALFGLLRWEDVSAAIRDRALLDLCGLPAFDGVRFGLVLAVKTEAVRAAIRDGLKAHGCGPRVLSQVGLS